MNILTSRQEKILELIVLEYVKTVNPVDQNIFVMN